MMGCIVCNGAKPFLTGIAPLSMTYIHTLNVVADNFLSNKPVLYAWCVVVVCGVWCVVTLS